MIGTHLMNKTRNQWLKISLNHLGLVLDVVIVVNRFHSLGGIYMVPLIYTVSIMPLFEN